MAGVGMAMGIGREVARDVLDELASSGPEAGGEEDRRQVGTAAAERDDAVALAACQKAGDDDDVVVREQRRAGGADGQAAVRAPRAICRDSPVWCTLTPVARTPRA